MAEEAKKKDRTRWFREMKSELKKIVWSDRKTVVKDTGTVLLCSLLIGVCIWVFDYVLVNGVQLLINFLS
ncbi:preprotein translocase subunit SecE [Oscillibacter sp.]|uniref:preprotein translocase subunit SecE n=1 Tax=Oscillibacter sp. TaxID=1945593 RepID=UPI0033963F66